MVMTFFRRGMCALIFSALYFVLPHAHSQEHQQHRKSAASLASGVAVSPLGDIWLAGVFEKRLFTEELERPLLRLIPLLVKSLNTTETDCMLLTAHNATLLCLH